MQGGHRGGVPHDEADPVDQTGRFGKPAELPCLRTGDCQRFFADDMGSCRHGCAHRTGMGVVGCDDADQIELFCRQHREWVCIDRAIRGEQRRGGVQ